MSDLRAWIPVSYPVLLAAVDPDAEAAMSGLDQAVTSGRPLTSQDASATDDQGDTVMPVLAATRLEIDEQVSASIERVTPAPGGKLTDALTGERGVVARVAALPGEKVLDFGPVAASASYERLLADGPRAATYWTTGTSAYDSKGSGLTVRPATTPKSIYMAPDSPDFALPLPVGSDDRGFRPISPHWLNPNQDNFPGFEVVGRFNPDRVTGPGRLSGLTAETYVSPALPGADAASRQALGGQPLTPSANVGGYAAQPPTLLTTLAGGAPLMSTLYHDASPEAPISVVRVRLDGIEGTDPVSRERLNQAALAIAQRTGLAVDIVAGASGVPTTVALPAGLRGRPELRLLENWARKGVAYDVVDAVDRKSLAMFGLILVVCTLVVGNAASAAVRTRRTELGVLSCLGWGAGRLFGVVLLELSLVGLLAGALGTLVALPLASALGLSASPERAALAVPAAVMLAVIAGLLPAIRAARAAPIDAVQPLVHAPRRARPIRSLSGFAAQGLRRVPGRTVLGSASLAVGVAAATFLLAVNQVFDGLVVGSLLGNAVAVQVRTPDAVALAAIALLGAAGVADVLYLATREQAPEFAALRATGWTDGALSRVVLGQGIGIGLLGGLAGAAAGCAAVAAFTGSTPAGLVLPVILATMAGVVVATLAALIPAVLIRRLPTAALIAEEAG